MVLRVSKYKQLMKLNELEVVISSTISSEDCRYAPKIAA